MGSARTVVFALVAIAVAVAVVGQGVQAPSPAHSGEARASSPEATANFTFAPTDRQSRRPGYRQASYSGFLTLPRSWATVESITVRVPIGVNASACSAGNIRAVGIDRGNNRSGTATDDPILRYLEGVNFSSPEDGRYEYTFEFYTNESEGTPLSVDEGDQFVASVAGCFTNPAEPGWYRVNATVNGTASDGTLRNETYTSNWFAVCNCTTRADARSALGGTPTPTPTATPSPTASPTPTDPPSQGGSGFGVVLTVAAAAAFVASRTLR